MREEEWRASDGCSRVDREIAERMVMKLKGWIRHDERKRDMGKVESCGETGRGGRIYSGVGHASQHRRFNMHPHPTMLMEKYHS